MCTRFEALPDLTRSVFRTSGQKFLSYDVDVLEKKEQAARSKNRVTVRPT